MNNKTLLIVAGILVVFGLLKPDIGSFFKKKPVNNIVVVEDIIVVSPPSDEAIKNACMPVMASIAGGPDSRVKDGKRLANLFLDIATLIELDGENEVIKTTDEIRQANGLCGAMLKMDIKNKYPKLAESANGVLIAAIGDESTILSPGLRAKSAEAFRGLAWACNEGTK